MCGFCKENNLVEVKASEFRASDFKINKNWKCHLWTIVVFIYECHIFLRTICFANSTLSFLFIPYLFILIYAALVSQRGPYDVGSTTTTSKKASFEIPSLLFQIF